jgi:hypothetical protein
MVGNAQREPWPPGPLLGLPDERRVSAAYLNTVLLMKRVSSFHGECCDGVGRLSSEQRIDQDNSQKRFAQGEQAVSVPNKSWDDPDGLIIAQQKQRLVAPPGLDLRSWRGTRR